LQGDDGDGLNGSEAGLEGGEGDDEADDSAIGVANEEALVETVLGALVGDEVEVGEVDGRDDKRDEGVTAVIFGIREDGEVGLEKLGLWGQEVSSCSGCGEHARKASGQGRTNLAGDIRVQSAEDEITVRELGGLALAHDEVADGTHGRGLFPPHGIAILLASRSGGGTDGNKLKVGVLAEEKNEALANGASAAEDTWKINQSA